MTIMYSYVYLDEHGKVEVVDFVGPLEPIVPSPLALALLLLLLSSIIATVLTSLGSRLDLNEQGKTKRHKGMTLSERTKMLIPLLNILCASDL